MIHIRTYIIIIISIVALEKLYFYNSISKREDFNTVVSYCADNSNKSSSQFASHQFIEVDAQVAPLLQYQNYWVKFEFKKNNVDEDVVVTFADHGLHNVLLYYPKINKFLATEEANLLQEVHHASYYSYLLKNTKGEDVIFFYLSANRGSSLNIQIDKRSHFQRDQLIKSYTTGACIFLIIIIIISSLFNFLKYNDKLFLWRTLVNLGVLSVFMIYEGIWHLVTHSLETEIYIFSFVYINTIIVGGNVYSQNLINKFSEEHYNFKIEKHLSQSSIILCVAYIITYKAILFYSCFALFIAIFSLYIHKAVVASKENKALKIYILSTALVISCVGLYILQFVCHINSILFPISIIKLSLIIEVILGLYIQHDVIKQMEYRKRFNHNLFKSVSNKNREVSEENNPISKLTKREEQICMLLVQGHKNTEVAEQLFISLSTVKFHRKNIYRKLDVNNITELQENYKKTEELTL